MDPRVHPDQDGTSSDSSQTESGAGYLQKLKKLSKGEAVPGPVSKEIARPARPQSLPAKIERRRNPRFRCTGSVEFRSAGSDIRMWGTLNDISLHGCYVEMSSTVPAGTLVDLSLEAREIRVHVRGEVRACYPSLGMGIAFRDIEPEQLAALGQLLAALAEQRNSSRCRM